MDAFLVELMQAAEQGPEHLMGLLDRNRNKISPELATAARQVFKQAISADAGATALLATLVASGIYSCLGDRLNLLRNQMDFWQLHFMEAETAEQYSLVRENFQWSITKADELPAPALAFEAAVLEAECAYFGAEATTGPRSEQWLLTTLRDLVAACDRASAVEHDAVFLKFVDLLATAVDRGMSRVLLGPEGRNLRYKIVKVADATRLKFGGTRSPKPRRLG